jgi:hypothetical protein
MKFRTRSLEKVVDVREQIGGEIESERLVREKTQRSGKAVRSLIDKGGVENSPIAFATELLFKQKWLVPFIAPPKAVVARVGNVAKRL